MKCVVTGAAGFIGSHLSERLLKEGHRVVGVDAFTDAYDLTLKRASVQGLLKEEAFQLIEGDLTEIDLQTILDGVDLVFHQAAQPGVRSSWGGEFHHYAQRNVLATQRLLEACKGGALRRFVYASSSSVYGDSLAHPTPEEALPRPLSPYGVTKLAAEHLCILYWKNYGVPSVSLRYFTVYGPRQRPDMAFHRFLKALWMGEPLVLYGDGKQSRDFTYVSDVVEANLKATELGRLGEVYNIGGGARSSLLEALAIMEKVTGRRPTLVRENSQRGDVRHTWAQISRAREELEFKPMVSLEEGIARESEWMLSTLRERSPY